ncbi:transcription initiation factor TFIID complex subunit TAF6, partial [Cardiosporidium cionae]
EHRFFFEEVKDTVRSAIVGRKFDYSRRFYKMLHILRTSMGLEQLLPFLLQFFASEISKCSDENSPFGLSVLLRFFEALIQNSNLRFHHYVSI